MVVVVKMNSCFVCPLKCLNFFNKGVQAVGASHFSQLIKIKNIAFHRFTVKQYGIKN